MDSKMNNKMDNKLTMFALTWPIFVETLLRLSLGNVNTFMLSKYSDNAVAAVGVANQVLGMMIMIYAVVATGTSIIVNQNLGAEKHETASRVASAAIYINLSFGLLMSIVLVSFSSPILRLMNLNEDIFGYAQEYFIIVGAASFTQALQSILSAVMRSYGHTKQSMYVAICMNILNIIGNYIVVFRPLGLPAFGVAGIAVTVVISQIFGVCALFVFMKRLIPVNLGIKSFFPFPRSILWSILKIGAPSAGEYLSYSASQIATTYIITMMASYALTTKIYVQNLTQLIWMLGISIGQATCIIVGHLIGAGKFDEANKTCFRSLKIAMIADTLAAIVFALLGKQLIGIFTDDPRIINTGATLFLIGIILEPGRAFNLVVMNSLRGAGDVRYPVIMGIFSMWGVSVILCYVLGILLDMGLIGIWLAFAVDEWVRGLIMYFRWRSRTWQSMALVTPQASAAAQADT